jgi:hypothetical protein
VFKLQVGLVRKHLDGVTVIAIAVEVLGQGGGPLVDPGLLVDVGVPVDHVLELVSQGAVIVSRARL